MADHKEMGFQQPVINTFQNLITGIVYHIRRLMQVRAVYTKEVYRKHLVSVPQLLCVLTLYEHGPLPLSQIAGMIMVNSSTVTGIIDRLEQKGLVERSRTSRDRRVVTVALTEAGASLAQNAPPPIHEKIMEGLQRLSRDELTQILKGLSMLTGLIETEDLVEREPKEG
jgi:DNA-binding MarR family transcriptional regulator